MDEYYKNTLTGNILTIIDYYLKCYVNGGFLKKNLYLIGKIIEI